MARGAGARARRRRQAPRGAADRAPRRRRRPDHDRGREDPVGGARRGAGDDRHLRLRRRALTPARGPHDALRAARPPADGDLAPAGRRRRHLGVQLPGRRLVLEHRGRARLRRHGRVEALADDAPHLRRLLRAAGPRRGGLRRAGEPQHAPDRRRGRRPGAGRQSLRRAAQRDRLRAHGGAGRPARRGTVRTLPARARREQRGDRHAVGGPRPGDPRHRVQRRRDGRAALYDDAAPDRPRGRRRRARRAPGADVRPAARRRPAERGRAGRPADQRPRPRGDGRRRSPRRRATAARSSPAATGARPPGIRRPSTSSRRSCACPARRRWCGARPSPRSSTS